MKETITKCNHCGAEIAGPVRLLTFNGEDIDLCSDQCRLKWWIEIANDAEAAGLGIHITSKPEVNKEKQSTDVPERSLKMLSRKTQK